MDPRRVLTFRAVAHERSFSRAARRLALSQPSVSNQVAALEREVGVRLLERRPGGLRLTPEGEILLEHADAIADRFGLAETQLSGAAERQRTRLRIGALPSALAELVPAAIARVREEHPDTRVTVDEGTSEELAGRLASGELDLAIAYQDTTWPRAEPPGVKRHHLLHEEFMVAMAPDHPRAAQTRSTSPNCATTTGPPPSPTGSSCGRAGPRASSPDWSRSPTTSSPSAAWSSAAWR